MPEEQKEKESEADNGWVSGGLKEKGKYIMHQPVPECNDSNSEASSPPWSEESSDQETEEMARVPTKLLQELEQALKRKDDLRGLVQELLAGQRPDEEPNTKRPRIWTHPPS